MKQFLFLSLALVTASVAQAEVKPIGTVLRNRCGRPSVSQYVCTASAVGLNKKYISIDSPKGREIIPARVEQEDGITRYVGGTRNKRGQFTSRYELVISRVSDGKQVGTFYVNGRQTGLRYFELHTIYHTQKL